MPKIYEGMTSGQKVAFSLLISVLAFCAFTVVAFSGLFEILEVNFYQPVVQEIKEKKIEEIAAAQKEYLETLMRRFDDFTLKSEVKTYVETRASDSSVKNREILRSQLLSSTAALTGIRIISENGRNIFFSTFPSDLIEEKKELSYRDYDLLNEISYSSLSSEKIENPKVSFERKCKIIKDSSQNRLIFSFPFYNPRDEYSGTALFYCDATNFSQFLYNRNLIDINGFANLITSKWEQNKNFNGLGGFVFGLPNFGQDSIKNQILEKWQNSADENFWKLVPTENPSIKQEFSDANSESVTNEIVEKSSFCVFSFKPQREDFGFIALIYNENELKFPPYMQILLLATAFVTFYLAIFLILSFRHDDIVVIRDKVQRYENEFFIAYKKMGDAKGKNYLSEQKPVLERRILKSLGRKGKKHAAEFKAIFETYWQEMTASFGAPPVQISQSAAPLINADELKEIVRSSLEDILENGKIQIKSLNSEPRSPEPKANITESSLTLPDDSESAVEEAQLVEASDFGDVTDVAAVETENIEEIESLEEFASAESEEIPEVEDATPENEIPEIKGAKSENDAAPNEIEEVEEISDLEEISEPDAIGKAKSESEKIPELEEVEEIEPLEEISELEEVESAELEEIPEPEETEIETAQDEIEEVEEFSDLEEIPAPEAIEKNKSESEKIPELEEVEEIEPLEEISELEEVGSAELEEIPEPEETEIETAQDEIEELEELSDLEEISAPEEVESVEEIEPAELEEIESVEEIPELEEILDDDEEGLKLGDGRVESENREVNFSAVNTIDSIQNLDDEELEILSEVDESEERAADIAKTLAALPERAPSWADNDDVELDSEGLIRKHSFSELHDIQKLKDVVDSIDELDTELEELEPFDPAQKKEKQELVDTDYFVPHLLDNNVPNDDDIYKDERLLEKIEFGVPSSDILDDDSDNSVAENFVAVAPDYSFLDEISADEKLYDEAAAKINNEHFFVNKNLLNSEEDDDIAELEEIDDLEELEVLEEEPLEFSDEIIEEIPVVQTEKSETENSNSLEIEELESPDEDEDDSVEKFEKTPNSAEIKEEPIFDDIEEVEALEDEENMPFMFTNFAANQNMEITELESDSDAIVQDSDGTFHLTDFSKSKSKLSLNMDFKKLVDSILN